MPLARRRFEECNDVYDAYVSDNFNHRELLRGADVKKIIACLDPDAHWSKDPAVQEDARKLFKVTATLS